MQCGTPLVSAVVSQLEISIAVATYLCAVLGAGLTPFHFAVFKGHRDLAEWLLGRGSNAHAADPTGA